jgi:hypothetical protein
MLQIYRCITACHILFLRLPVTCSLYIDFFSHLFSIFFIKIYVKVLFSNKLYTLFSGCGEFFDDSWCHFKH